MHCLSDVLLEKKGEPYNYHVSFELAVTNIIVYIEHVQRVGSLCKTTVESRKCSLLGARGFNSIY